MCVFYAKKENIASVQVKNKRRVVESEHAFVLASTVIMVVSYCFVLNNIQCSAVSRNVSIYYHRNIELLFVLKLPSTEIGSIYY